jgi:hypothetical protein
MARADHEAQALDVGAADTLRARALVSMSDSC